MLFLPGKSCKISYGSGIISGFFSKDNVLVGEVVAKDQVGHFLCIYLHQLKSFILCILNFQPKYLFILLQIFIETTREVGPTFLLAKFDGIVGLGFQEISVENAPPLWYAFLYVTVRYKEIANVFLTLSITTGIIVCTLQVYHAQAGSY